MFHDRYDLVCRPDLHGFPKVRRSKSGGNGEPKMTEGGYYAGEFTDAELNCRADIADYQRAVEEFFLEHRDHMDEGTRAAFQRYTDEP